MCLFCGCVLCSSLLVPLVMGLSVLLLHLIWAKTSLKVLTGLMRLNIFSKSQTLREMCNNVPAAASVEHYMSVRLVATVLVMCFYFYNTVTRAALGMLTCVKIPGSSPRWVLDVRLACPTYAARTPAGAGAIFLGIVLLLLCLSWPITSAAVLIRAAHRGMLQTRGVVGSAASLTGVFAFRFADYGVDHAGLAAFKSGSPHHKAPACTAQVLQMHAVLIWDSILDLARFLLVVVALSVSLHELHQVVLVLWILGSYLVLALLVRPWRSPVVSRLQVASLFVLTMSCLGILACNIASDDEKDGPRPRYSVAVAWLVLLANFIYLTTAVVMLVRLAFSEIPWFAGLRRRLCCKQAAAGLPAQSSAV